MYHRCQGCGQETVYTKYCSDCQTDIAFDKQPGTFHREQQAKANEYEIDRASGEAFVQGIIHHSGIALDDDPHVTEQLRELTVGFGAFYADRPRGDGFEKRTMVEWFDVWRAVVEFEKEESEEV